VTLAPGTCLGPFEVLGPLAAGGVGEVYRARDHRLDREVAIKILSTNHDADPVVLERFKSEAKTVASLSHPNILTIYDFDLASGMCFAATELLEGETLRKRLARAPLPWRKAAEVGAAVADGLAAAHSKGVIHLDVKPENIFLTFDGRVKILDFGIAHSRDMKSLDAEQNAARSVPARKSSDSTIDSPFYVSPEILPNDSSAVSTEDASSPTVAGGGEEDTVLGTPPYMSPEQVRGEPTYSPSDIFSLGCVLYEMVTGHRSFVRQTAEDTMEAILNEDPPEISDWGKAIPKQFDRIIMRCLEKNQEERFQSARDLAFSLRTVVSGSRLSRVFYNVSRRRLGVWIVLGVVLIGLIMGYLLFEQSTRNSKAANTIAVLPFVNEGEGPTQEGVGEDIANDIITNLSRIPTLQVMSSGILLHYGNTDVDPRRVGRELNVRFVLVGRLVQRNGTPVVRVDLVDATNGMEIWSKQYGFADSHSVVVEEQIARDVSEKLRRH
jgi:serine/threonine protein kinase/TolB-like protein